MQPIKNSSECDGIGTITKLCVTIICMVLIIPKRVCIEAFIISVTKKFEELSALTDWPPLSVIVFSYFFVAVLIYGGIGIISS